MNRKLTTGTYATTPAFSAIPEHTAVCFDDDGGLVAVTGPANDPKSEAYARLFSAAPDLLEALREVTAQLFALHDCQGWKRAAKGPRSRDITQWVGPRTYAALDVAIAAISKAERGNQ